MKVKSVMMSQVVQINGHDYYVAEINTKGNREILELDIVKPSEGQPLTIEYVHNTKTGEVLHNGDKSMASKLIDVLQLFFCQKSLKWKLSY
ncbi:hypothetical protein JC221_073 [Yersinia phage JC221]|nr:hypothetical protein JC221_073 [Yersinia phage JC221]